MDVKVVEPIQSPMKEFNSVDEFNLFYHNHKDEMMETTTHRLNKMYKINGYRITKIRGELCLKRVHEAIKQKSDVDGRSPSAIGVENGDGVDDHDGDVVDIETRLQRLEEVVNEIIDALNGEAPAPTVMNKR